MERAVCVAKRDRYGFGEAPCERLEDEQFQRSLQAIVGRVGATWLT
jgi:hypothetical protein